MSKPTSSVSGAIALSFFSVLVALVTTGPRTAAGDRFRESEACLDCHEEQQQALLMSPHQITDTGADARVACTDCHPGSANHYEEDPEEYPMTNPAAADFSVTAGLCSGCHQNNHQQDMRERNLHPENRVRCTDCHQVHGVVREGLLKEKEPDLCYGCHPSVKGEFAQPYRHPVNDGIVRCSDCHMSVDPDRRLLSASRVDQACFRCHEYFQGPFPFEHQAAIGWSVEEGGCLMCHRPHGSSNPRMLNRSYEAPNFNLCTQCHSVPGHQNNAQHGTQWAGVPCNDCHADIHGSYTSSHYFSSALQAQTCFNASCHSF